MKWENKKDEDLLIKPHNPATPSILMSYFDLVAGQAKIGEETQQVPFQLSGSPSRMRVVGLGGVDLVLEDQAVLKINK